MPIYAVTTLEQYTYRVRADSESEAEDMDEVLETAHDNLHEIMSVELMSEDDEE